MILPEDATRPCRLTTLSGGTTISALEVAYMRRGAEVVACDAARQLAVETLMAERLMQDQLRTLSGGGQAKNAD